MQKIFSLCYAKKLLVLKEINCNYKAFLNQASCVGKIMFYEAINTLIDI
jgi:uracil phosphoribosyltransferase